MNSFLTGSRVYGKPKTGSDIDLVVRVSGKELEILKDQANAVLQIDNDYESKTNTTSLRFGSLNLICCTSDAEAAYWKVGTEKLKADKPVERDKACSFFVTLRKLYGCG